MQYVPCVPKEGHHLLDNGVSITYDNTQVMKLILGGDQLTAARVRGTQALCVSGACCRKLACKMAFIKVHRLIRPQNAWV